MSRLDEALLKVYEQQDPEVDAETSELPALRLSEVLAERQADAVGDEQEAATPVVDDERPAFRPMLQVDAFAWPEVLREATPEIEAELDEVAAVLLEPNGRRQTVVAMAGAKQQAGCSTLLLGAVRRLAQRGVNVAVVDADETEAALSASLGLLPSLGWEDIASGTQPLTEVLIESIEDRLALLPLCDLGEVARLAGSPSATVNLRPAIETLRENYDLVLVDLGSPGKWTPGLLDEMIDTAVIVHNVARGDDHDTQLAADQFAARRIACAGVIENCSPRSVLELSRRAA